MNTEIIVALIVFVGGGLSVVGNYLVHKRKTSGSIDTTEAATLWVELNAVKDEYKQRAEKYESRLEAVNAELDQVMIELTNWQTKGVRMAKRIDDLKRLVARLRKENARLLAERKQGTNEPRTT